MFLEPPVILNQARNAARKWVKDSEWSFALLNAEPEQPLLVRQPLPSDLKAYQPEEDLSDYYLVEFRVSGRPTGQMIIDATTGTFKELTGILDAGETLLPLLRHGDVPSKLNGYVAVFGKKKATINGAKVTVDGDLLWGACDQSRTPFKPFYRARYEKYILYVRVDGKIFTKLTQRLAGA